MTTRGNPEKAYLDELSHWLRRRGLDGNKIGDILAEVQTHVAATGEPAREAFGPPAAYARMWAPPPGRRRWPVAVPLLLSGGGGFALSVGALGVADGEPVLGSNGWLLALGLPLMVTAAAIIPVVRIIDPRSSRPFFRTRRALILTAAAVAVLIAVVFLCVGMVLSS